MRLLLITNDYPPKPGGIQQYLAGLVAALDADVRVIAPRDRGPAPGDVVRDRRRFMWPTRRVRRRIEDQVAEFRPDLLLFGAPHPLSSLGPGLRRATGVPYAVLCHGAEITLPAAFPVTRQLVRRPLRRADLLLAVSRFTAARVERLTRRPVEVVGAGVTAAFSPGAARPASPTVIGCVSRFVPRKGQARVVRAAERLHSAGKDVEVLLAGSGRDEARLRRVARRAGVPVRFEVGVPFEQLPEIYRQIDVFAMPCRSRWFGLEAEGLGVVFLEAASTGLPVVAGRSGGAPETVDPGRTGFVVDGDDALHAALLMLIEDPGLRREMGNAGRERALRMWGWDAVAERFARAVATVVGDGL